MRLTFALPCYASNPLGGLKVVYEYANRLTERGHRVAVVHPRTIARPGTRVDGVKSHLWASKVRLRDRPLVPWFPLSPEVEVRLVRSLDHDAFPPADAVVATAWMTAETVHGLPPDRGRKLYFVQDVEFWETEPSDVRAEIERTFRLGLAIVAVSPAAGEMVRSIGVEPVAVIPSGIDGRAFNVVTPIEDRDRFAVGFPVRRESHKGTHDALAALEILRERLGSRLRPAAFGTGLPAQLPAWIRGHEAPDDSELASFYNSLAVFVLPSHHEAWGLPGLEAQACGAALVAADNAGVRGYARDGQTALLVPPGEPELLAAAVERIVRDDTLRFRLAARGAEAARRYDWASSVEGFEAALDAA